MELEKSTESKEGKLVLYVTNPRSMSSVTSMIFSNFSNTNVYMDKLVEVFFEYMIKKFSNDEEKAKSIEAGKVKLESILNDVEKDLKNGKIVIFKDMALHFSNPFFYEPLTRLTKQYKTYYLYGVRNPIPRLVSMKKTVEMEIKLNIRDVNMLENILKMERYPTLKEFMSKNKGFILNIEQFQEFPKETLQKMWKFLEVDEEVTEEHLFIKDLMNKENVIVYLDYTDPYDVDNSWYKDCLISKNTFFRKKKVEIIYEDFKESWEKDLIDKELIVYNQIIKMNL